METYKHLLWECEEARLIWECYNSYLRRLGVGLDLTLSFEDIFKTEHHRALSMLKVRIVQAMIQIERPTAWNIDKIKKLALELKCIELYNAQIKHKFDSTKTKWNLIT